MTEILLKAIKDLSSSLVNSNIVEQIETQNLTSSTQSLSIDLS